MVKPKDLEMQNELTELQKKEYEKKIDDYRKQVISDREAARALEMDQSAKKTTFKDERGNEISYIDDAMHHAEQVINERITTVNDWRACMIGLLNMFSKLVTGLDAEINKKTNPYIVMAKALIVDKGFGGALDYFVDLYKKSGNANFTLASLEHNVQYTDDNKLHIDLLSRSDGVQEKGNLDILFEKGIVKWLAENGYTPDSADKTKFLDVNGKALDKASFEKLKNDPYHGLSHFLEETSNLSFTQAPTPRPY